jgi:hypothetical protein
MNLHVWNENNGLPHSALMSSSSTLSIKHLYTYVRFEVFTAVIRRMPSSGMWRRVDFV